MKKKSMSITTEYKFKSFEEMLKWLLEDPKHREAKSVNENDLFTINVMMEYDKKTGKHTKTPGLSDDAFAFYDEESDEYNLVEGWVEDGKVLEDEIAKNFSIADFVGYEYGKPSKKKPKALNGSELFEMLSKIPSVQRNAMIFTPDMLTSIILEDYKNPTE